jgi:hypothetical protein
MSKTYSTSTLAALNIVEWGAGFAVLASLLAAFMASVSKSPNFNPFMPLVPGIAAGYATIGLFSVRWLAPSKSWWLKTIFAFIGGFAGASTYSLVFVAFGDTHSFSDLLGGGYSFVGIFGTMAVGFAQSNLHESRRLSLVTAIRTFLSFL